MQDLIKNMLYLGAGAAFMTKEKLEEHLAKVRQTRREAERGHRALCWQLRKAYFYFILL